MAGALGNQAIIKKSKTPEQMVTRRGEGGREEGKPRKSRAPEGKMEGK